jgi:hypothetical protein
MVSGSSFTQSIIGFLMIMKQLTKYGLVAPLKPQHCSYAPNLINYGKDNQSLSPLDNSLLLDKAGKKCTQQTAGSFLYYA